MESGTCIIGIVQKGKIWIGADAAGGDGLNRVTLKEPKVCKRRGEDGTVWLFGYSGIPRFFQLIKYGLVLPKIGASDRKGILGFMVKRFIPALRKCLSEGGYEKKEGERITTIGSRCLVGVEGNLFIIEPPYQVISLKYDYAVIGCGEHVAYGSLFSTTKMEPRKRILTALQAAEEFNAAVRNPFTIFST